MRIIMECDPEQAADVLALIMSIRPMFDGQPERLGWGWTLQTAKGDAFFVRQIKSGLSARPARPA